MTTKKITFKCNGLGREAKIMLFFMSRRLMNSAELSVPTQSPVAWKVIRFAPYGESEATVTWTDTWVIRSQYEWLLGV
ncbi:hypothetical protein C8Q76DRAFT_757428 [Earliella scabrosa]|nr:hypothetical protein C8Q76DRAFT_757428 [Earliella scabrosa]